MFMGNTSYTEVKLILNTGVHTLTTIRIQTSEHRKKSMS